MRDLGVFPADRRTNSKWSHFLSVIHDRRSVREFFDRKVSDAAVKKLVGIVRYAPSSLNGQSVEILVVQKRALKKRLVAFKNKWCPQEKRDYRADFMLNAPVVLVVCVDNRRSHKRTLENGVIASTYVMLAASALGLGTTYLTAYNLKKPAQLRELRRILRTPERITPVSLLPIGYPAGKPSRKKLRTLSEILHHESF